MERLLSKTLLFGMMLFAFTCFSQEGNDINERDYKDKKQFEKFMKKRKAVGSWQINQLKKGALVIKLRTNRGLIEQLEKAGKKELAEQKRIEAAVINKTTMLAFIDNFKFCKLYFIYSHFGDSLLNGARKGIFLDTNLMVDASIEMTEKFYMLAEKDRVYNSSIGFVKEDSARKVRETGNPSGYDVLAVVKNKYGHQLKKPFPYICGYGVKNSGAITSTFIKAVPVYYFASETFRYSITVDKTQMADYKENPKKQFKRGPTGAQTFMLPKENAYEILAQSIQRFDEDLFVYYKGSPAVEEDKLPDEVRPFLY